MVALGLLAAVPSTRLGHALAGSVLLSNHPPRTLGTLATVTIEEVEATGTYGVSQLDHLAVRQLVSLEACVSCGRCQDESPAHAAGKPLSPRDVVQDLAGQLPGKGSEGATGRSRAAPPRAGARLVGEPRHQALQASHLPTARARPLC